MAAYKMDYEGPVIHSEEVDEIMSQAPNRLIRYGIVGLLMVLLLFITLSWFIEWPDRINGFCTINASMLPKPVVARADGSLIALWVTENEKVKKNQPLGLISNSADYQNVTKLEHLVDIQWHYMHQGNFRKIEISPFDFKNMGELQNAFQDFYTLYTQMCSFASKETNSQKYRVVQKASIINNPTTYIRENELSEINKKYFEVKSNFIQALNRLSNDITSWKQHYLIVAPAEGIITFSDAIQENQELFVGKEIFQIESFDHAIYAQILISQANLDKIVLGQSVIIKLSGYPFQKYGFLEGHITTISRVFNKNKEIVVKVALIKGLTTNIGYHIGFMNGLTADAEIIIKKSNLFSKLFQAREIFNGH